MQGKIYKKVFKNNKEKKMGNLAQVIIKNKTMVKFLFSCEEKIRTVCKNYFLRAIMKEKMYSFKKFYRQNNPKRCFTSCYFCNNKILLLFHTWEESIILPKEEMYRLPDIEDGWG